MDTMSTEGTVMNNKVTNRKALVGLDPVWRSISRRVRFFGFCSYVSLGYRGISGNPYPMSLLRRNKVLPSKVLV